MILEFAELPLKKFDEKFSDPNLHFLDAVSSPVIVPALHQKRSKVLD